MAGYAAVARLGRVDVHVARPTTDPYDRLEQSVDALEPSVEDLAGQPFEAQVADFLATIREQWAMTTFFLFDPESWR